MQDCAGSQQQALRLLRAGPGNPDFMLHARGLRWKPVATLQPVRLLNLDLLLYTIATVALPGRITGLGPRRMFTVFVACWFWHAPWGPLLLLLLLLIIIIISHQRPALPVRFHPACPSENIENERADCTDYREIHGTIQSKTALHAHGVCRVLYCIALPCRRPW